MNPDRWAIPGRGTQGILPGGQGRFRIDQAIQRSEGRAGLRVAFRQGQAPEGIMRSRRRAAAGVKALKGSDEVALKLFDVTVGGKAYELATNYAEVKSSGKGASTAKTTAVTTGVGAALGGIFGGGKGAAIGAGAGAGTGVAISAARGKTLKIPSESRLDFVLRAPLPLN